MFIKSNRASLCSMFIKSNREFILCSLEARLEEASLCLCHARFRAVPRGGPGPSATDSAQRLSTRACRRALILDWTRFLHSPYNYNP